MSGGPTEVIGPLERTAAEAGLGPGAVVAWIARGVERLVVDRLGRNSDDWRRAREALQAASGASSSELEAALATVARRLSKG